MAKNPQHQNRPATTEIPQVWKRILLAGVLVYLGLFYTQKIIFVNADLGRHIVNGRVFFESGAVLTTNYYSYTESDFPTVNHHWGTGVIFYAVWKAFGFIGLTLLNTLLHVSAVGLAYRAAVKRSHFASAFVCLVAAVPLLTARTEIRPEAFSLLLLGVFYYLLVLHDAGEISFKRLTLILLPLQMIWVNLHIFFILGPILIGVFWLDSLLGHARRPRLPGYSLLLAAALLACFVNPSGYQGVLEPFLILREYGFMIAENHSVFLMQRRFPTDLLYYHFEMLVVTALVGYLILVWKTRRLPSVPDAVILLLFTLSSFRAIRGIPLFGLFFIPVMAACLAAIERLCLSFHHQARLRTAAVALAVFAVVAGGVSGSVRYSPWRGRTGLDLIEGVSGSAEFIRRNDIQGPIFNNYDIGGYLIFHLFPRQRVFVDNRPEAYSVRFFEEIYEPMQADPVKWAEIDGRYRFNCIIFFRHDMTTYGQPFLLRMLQDSQWAPVFVDEFTLILLRRNSANAAVIARFQLPPTLFRRGPP